LHGFPSRQNNPLLKAALHLLKYSQNQQPQHFSKCNILNNGIYVSYPQEMGAMGAERKPLSAKGYEENAAP